MQLYIDMSSFQYAIKMAGQGKFTIDNSTLDAMATGFHGPVAALSMQPLIR